MIVRPQLDAAVGRPAPSIPELTSADLDVAADSAPSIRAVVERVALVLIVADRNDDRALNRKWFCQAVERVGYRKRKTGAVLEGDTGRQRLFFRFRASAGILKQIGAESEFV